MPEFIDNGLNGYLTMESLPYHDPHETVTGERMAEDNLHITRLRDELVGRMHWMQHHPDETLAMGRAARQTILNGWTWKQQTEHVARMWREMLNSR
jgi:ParB-like chromosome segregation protein Spo0J